MYWPAASAPTSRRSSESRSAYLVASPWITARSSCRRLAMIAALESEWVSDRERARYAVIVNRKIGFKLSLPYSKQSLLSPLLTLCQGFFSPLRSAWVLRNHNCGLALGKLCVYQIVASGDILWFVEKSFGLKRCSLNNKNDKEFTVLKRLQ